MIRRKGELSSAMMDVRWPYQVALPETEATGPLYHIVHGFCRDLSLCPRKHSVTSGGQSLKVFCFATEEDAKKFMETFGGEKIGPTKRGRGRF